MAVALIAIAIFERQSLFQELTTRSATLNRLASQRADQHDAHLTSLSAILIKGGLDRQDLFLEVATTIKRFYPRIVSVHVIAFEPAARNLQTYPGLSDEDAELVRQVAQRSTGALGIEQLRAKPEQYLVVKRSPNTDKARHGLALVVDSDALIETDDPFWQRPSVFRRLIAPDGKVLTGGPARGKVGFSRSLGSTSQPLILETGLRVGVIDILPLGKSLLSGLLVTALFILIIFGLKQRRRTKDAESLATLSAQETRLAHASRVNAMGEMASGMAHELAQPLTAILSQAQAGRHLAKRGNVERLTCVLNDTVLQAQRAADIIERLRRWSMPNPAPAEICSLNEAARNVALLLQLEANSSGADISLELSDEPVLIQAGPVELEQVVFNLVRNAIEASAGAKIVVRTSRSGNLATLDVSDNGPGVAEELRSRIFEPFVTGKPDGTGLGLALCQRLVEGMDGDVEFLRDTPQTTFRLTFPVARARQAS